MPNDAERTVAALQEQAAAHYRTARILHMQGHFAAAIKWQQWAAATARAARGWRG